MAGPYFRNKPKKRSATQATRTAISHLHRSMIYLTFMMNIIIFLDSINFLCLVANYIKFHWCAYIKEAVG